MATRKPEIPVTVNSPPALIGTISTAADEAVEPPYQPSFPIVGIGASAGGLDAVCQLLKALPADTGMGFVVVQHLSPERVSLLPEILGRATQMPVAQVQGTQAVQRNHVYVIPPGLDMCLAHGALELVPRSSSRGQHYPIDQFFRSLADDQTHCAIGVILSGTANDGTLGVEDIRGEGGITFAQDDSAQEASMPRSAVATGCVDFVLPPAAIAAELTRIASHPLTAPEPAEGAVAAADARWLGRILQRLSSASGVDFARYKASTVGRRVSRRMALHKIPDWKDYERFLQRNPGEINALYEDVLIHVTRFFRDPEVFEALRATVLPRLFEGRSPEEPLRIWVLGCSSGEEAYSIAIACAEYAEEHSQYVPVQLFASDLSAQMIDKARAAIYPESISQDVSPERLRRFFTKESGGYRVSRVIRDTCVFAPHNVLADPPFSRMDLVSCRNLLIYMEPALQQQILPVLHYALKPGGVLLLGKSETTGAARDLFEVEDARFRIYSRAAGSPARLTLSQFPSSRRSGRAEAPTPKNTREPAASDNLQREAERVLAARYAPPGVLVDANLQILQYWGDTSAYLAPLPGKATLNVLRLIRPGLLVALRSAIQKARGRDPVVRHDGLRAQPDGSAPPVSLEVSRVPRGAAAARGFLILFEEATPGVPRSIEEPAFSPLLLEGRAETLERENLRLTQELEGTRDYLQAMIEQEQAVNEELQSASEEAQSANEELQSINEELETSKEEIQATNEELTTVNEELHNRNQELHRVSNDWVNLLESVEAPIIIVGRDLRIRRYSPVAGDVLNLIPADVGRPISDVNIGLGVDVNAVVTEVINSLVPQEWQIQRHGRWYLARVRPYRTLERKVEGAVLVFVDVDTLKRAQQYAEAIMCRVREPLLVLDQQLRVRTANSAFYESFHATPAETEGQLFFELGAGQWDLPVLRRLLQEVAQDDASFEDFLVENEGEQRGPKSMRINARRLSAEAGDAPLIILAIEDITARRALENLLRGRADELAEADHRKNEFLAMLGHELRNPLAPVTFANEILARGVAGDAALERQCQLIDRQIQQMGHLLDDLLEGSRVSRGMVTLHRVTIDLAALVAHCVAAATLVFELRHQMVSYLGPPVPVTTFADPVRLEQVVTNLLSNAGKYTPPGGKIRITLAHEEDTVILSVADTGIGIIPELLPRIFDLFTQGERSLDRREGGLGVGLTLVRSLVELHGGTVEARSEGLGCGSEIVVRLPIAKDLTLPPEKPAKVNVIQPEAADVDCPPRILVVDDNQDGADTLVELGESWGYELRAAYDGAAAIELARSYCPQVVLLDIGLPGLDGYEVARRLRSEIRLTGVKLVAFTGYGSNDDRERARKAGFDHHITKPVNSEELRTLLFALAPPAAEQAGGRRQISTLSVRETGGG